MFSSKHLNYLNWSEALNIISTRNHLTFKGSINCLKLKNSMNSKRTVFSWDHLLKFYSE